MENSSDIYAQEEVSELLQIKTHYELQWLGRGKLIKYLAFRPHRNDFIEPEVEIEPDDYRSYGRDRREQVVNALKENENS
jgi:tRNA (guanine-N7-)-methyltransferase